VARPLKTRLVIALSTTWISCIGAGETPSLRAGDIVFQTSRSAQSEAVQLATHSRYSHMGLVLPHAGRLEVLEAGRQVKFTPLPQWIGQGVGGRLAVKRLKDPSALSDPGALARLERAALEFQGRPYDPYFEWSDDRIYCSELVWKACERGLGLHLGELATLGSFDLSSEAVRARLKERFGSAIPTRERVISPQAMFDSPLLRTVE
jgi:permuted papain-like amidase YaeF/Yiix C92 family enzyme